jgi:hypothetical protein
VRLQLVLLPGDLISRFTTQLQQLAELTSATRGLVSSAAASSALGQSWLQVEGWSLSYEIDARSRRIRVLQILKGGDP